MLPNPIQNSEPAHRLSQIGIDLRSLLPEAAIISVIILLILFDLIFKRKKAVGLTCIVFFGLALIFMLLLQQWQVFAESGSLMGGLLDISRYAILFKIGFVIGLAIALVTVMNSSQLKEDFFSSGEVLVMLLGLLLGVCLMTMSVNLLLIYLSIEVVSICSYALTGINKGKKRAEAALKYLIYGAIASAIMLYGMSWLYGFTGTLNITSPAFLSGVKGIPQLPLSIAVLMTLGGFVFKLGAFPLHIWSPDVYEAAPTPVVAVFSVLPKLAALSIMLRFSYVLRIELIDWQLWLAFISVASMTVGNFSALWQRDIKRILAYSSIAHAGFLLIGIMAFSLSGNQSMLFYAMVYLMMNFAIFFLVSVFETHTGATTFEEYKGLSQHFPYLSVLVVVVMVSLTGLPPTAGFSAKLLIFTALWESYEASGKPVLLWVFIFGLFNTVIALFYYLKLPYLLFFKQQKSTITTKPKLINARVWATVLVFPLLIFFFRPDWLLALINNIKFTFSIV